MCKLIKRVLRTLWTLILITSCASELTHIPVTDITLNTKSIALCVGDTEILTASVSPFNATNTNIIWGSTDSSVARVSAGVVEALSEGTTQIIAKTDDGGKIATCNVVVKSKTEDAQEGESESDDKNDCLFESTTVDVLNITPTTATIKVHIDIPQLDLSFTQVAVYYSNAEPFNLNNATMLSTTDFDINGDFLFHLTNLQYNSIYNYVIHLKVKEKEEYSDILNFTTSNIELYLQPTELTGTTAGFSGTVSGLTDKDYANIEIGVIYSQEAGQVEQENGSTFSPILSKESFSAVAFKLSELQFNTKYYYRSYIKQNDDYCYGEVNEFQTKNFSFEVSARLSAESLDEVIAVFSGVVTGISKEDIPLVHIGIAYSDDIDNLTTLNTNKFSTTLNADASFEISRPLSIDVKYYYCPFIEQNDIYIYGNIQELQTYHPYSVETFLNMSQAYDLSFSEPANCYIVSDSGTYKFRTTKGNSNDSVGSVSTAAILWESFGSSSSTEFNELIRAIYYKDGYIAFQVAEDFKEGNACVAAKDADGNILWSWHIWLTDPPRAQVYFNNAGAMMDRNLGATNVTPGDAASLGLLYQWGRKDPFLGSSSISTEKLAKSSVIWPSCVESDTSTGTIEYTLMHPMTFILYNRNTTDWQYNQDDTRWQSTKTIYDPCPAGWHVPESNESVWAKALGGANNLTEHEYNTTNKGMDFYNVFGSESSIWYPAAGYLYRHNGSLAYVGVRGCYWTCSTKDKAAYCFSINSDDSVNVLSDTAVRSRAHSIRCAKK